ncbi:MAG: HDOD domain-containing protein [Deltaproteobacteria bacterium]|nr:HDOD domain-containing protein [Candidatus Anaeroferrophillus wilburensis]MBN2888703.1 HDOD domain-containing protein [Deltaproteobacteria bacterium]
MNTYVARQPIFDQQKNIYAYELLFRDGTANFAQDIDGDEATATVLQNSIITIGMDEIAGGKKSFINFTQNLLVKKIPLLLARENIVVEILEDVSPEPALLAACQEIAQKGFVIALDDFCYSPEMEPLIDLADIIKFDFRASSVAEIRSYIDQLAGKNLRFLAEKVETNAEFQQALDLGFELFQGYFFCKPEILQGKEIPSSHIIQLQIMAEMNREDVDFSELETLISRDVGISYKLLRYINSPFFAKPSKISAIKQALVYMGIAEMRRFMSLMTITKLAEGKPHELVRLSCIRGKFCELMSRVTQKPVKPAELFTVGMFSLIDAIIDQPMEKIMAKLPFPPNMVAALVGKKGLLAGFLMLSIAYEQGRWSSVTNIASRLGVEESALPALYSEACQWSNSVAET